VRAEKGPVRDLCAELICFRIDTFAFLACPFNNDLRLASGNVGDSTVLMNEEVTSNWKSREDRT